LTPVADLTALLGKEDHDLLVAALQALWRERRPVLKAVDDIPCGAVKTSPICNARRGSLAIPLPRLPNSSNFSPHER
jgi:hypothetical protein